ncbi:CFI-box-CTERM domain-containing protein [Nitrososphaera viennensis]|uniref:Uncharacterized protein n=1 Tax=Nitrososphaera viennensis TaxID=1034015 RepID=A0A977IGY3_9ARCH|nr:CFI-box-CTERM domain-containing protein [Nitrososphaera viennensis]UVS70537.1 hypothetical protein NWT39_07065 [Nitrososphaera viennensis]
MKRYLAPLLLATLVFSSTLGAYGHGLGTDQSLPTTIGGRQVAVEASISPTFIESVGKSPPTLTIRTLDPRNNSTIAGGIDYRVVVEKGNNTLLDQEFRSSDGIVLAKLVPDANADAAQVNDQASPGRVNVSKDAPVEIRSRIMSDGGLYKVSVTLQTSSTGLQVESDRTFDLFVSVSKTQDFSVQTAEGDQKMSVMTYYADVSNLEYDRDTNSISFSMPFDWASSYVSQVPLVHMEVMFPKAIKELQVNGYRGSVDGKELPPDAVLIDDYSYEGLRVVHFVLNNDRLTGVKGSGNTMDFVLAPADKPKFPLDLLSTTEKYVWEMSWGPEVIESGSPTTFVMNVQDNSVGDLVRNASFDFVITKDGREVYRKHLASGQGTFSEQYTFLEPGNYRVAAQKINGENESAQIDVVVLQGSGNSNNNATTPTQQQQPSGCLIATAAFGSELTPQVQFLRGFRDNYVLKSMSGSAFMSIFNAVYYSFSPQVADYEREQPWLQATVKAALYPLFGILLASEQAFSSAGGGEGGTILAGAVASTLIGAVYVSPLAAGAAIAARKKVNSRTVAIAAIVAAGALVATLVAIAAGSVQVLSITTPAFVIALAAAAALAVVRLVQRKKASR